jgi:hypothetical protein
MDKAGMDIDPADFLALAASLNLPSQHRRSSSFSITTATTKPFTPEEQKMVNELEASLREKGLDLIYSRLLENNEFCAFQKNIFQLTLSDF